MPASPHSHRVADVISRTGRGTAVELVDLTVTVMIDLRDATRARLVSPICPPVAAPLPADRWGLPDNGKPRDHPCDALPVKQSSPAAERNREPIREVLARHLPDAGLVLEIASGTGEHAVHLARAFPQLTWQPTDGDLDALASIAAWANEAALPNLMSPLALDVTQPWPVTAADAIVCINMVHIAPWETTLALMAGAMRALPPRGLLYLYGPYRFSGAFTAPSNAEFDRSLRERDPRWGVRDIRELTAAASQHGIGLEHVIAMPANNHSLVFRRRAVVPATGRFIVT